MPTDPRLGIPYPANSDANDVPRDIKAVVDKIGPIMAVDMQGTAASRPAAGVRGRSYWATDTKALYRDDGTVWRPIYSDWRTWTPAFINTVGVTAALQNGDIRAKYRFSGATAYVKFKGLMRCSGTGAEYGVSLPLKPLEADEPGAANVQNTAGSALTRPSIGAAGGVILVKGDHTNLTTAFNFYDSFNIFYEIDPTALP